MNNLSEAMKFSDMLVCARFKKIERVAKHDEQDIELIKMAGEKLLLIKIKKSIKQINDYGNEKFK